MSFNGAKTKPSIDVHLRNTADIVARRDDTSAVGLVFINIQTSARVPPVLGRLINILPGPRNKNQPNVYLLPNLRRPW